VEAVAESFAARRRRQKFRLVARRLLFFIPTLLGMSLLVFAIGRISLVRPDIASLGFFATEQAKENFNERFHLDEPLITQYGIWLSDVATGDFGVSFITGTPVIDSVKSGAAVTIQLALGAAVLAAVFGVVLGTIGGLKPWAFRNRLISAGSLLAVSTPQFWLGLVLLIVVAQNLQLLPAGGYVPPSTDFVGFVKSMVLPWITLSVASAGIIARVTQVRVAEESVKPHVLTARSLGVSEYRVATRYTLRNSLVEPATVIGIQVGYMLGGAFVVEQVFNLPGVGQLAISAARQGDYPVVQAVALYTTVVFLLVNLAVDVFHLILDVRAGEG